MTYYFDWDNLLVGVEDSGSLWQNKIVWNLWQKVYGKWELTSAILEIPTNWREASEDEVFLEKI